MGSMIAGMLTLDALTGGPPRLVISLFVALAGTGPTPPARARAFTPGSISLCVTPVVANISAQINGASLNFRERMQCGLSLRSVMKSAVTCSRVACAHDLPTARRAPDRPGRAAGQAPWRSVPPPARRPPAQREPQDVEDRPDPGVLGHRR